MSPQNLSRQYVLTHVYLVCYKITMASRRRQRKGIPVFGVYLPPALQAWVRKRAREENRTLTAVVERAVLGYKAMIEQTQKER